MKSCDMEGCPEKGTETIGEYFGHRVVFCKKCADHTCKMMDIQAHYRRKWPWTFQEMQEERR